MATFRSFKELNQVRLGLVGLIITAVLMTVALNVGRIRSALDDTTFSAALSDAGGLHAGDDVRVSGLRVGQVKSVTLEGDHVTIAFSAHDLTLGDRSTAAVKSANVLGRKYLAVVPTGVGSATRIPLNRTNAGYSVSTALGDLTTTTGALDLGQISASVSSLATVLDQTPLQFRSALKGVSALSKTIASRNQALGDLLQHTSSLSGVLAQRNEEITSIMTNGSLLFDELDKRREAIQELFTKVADAADEISGFVADNKNTLGPALTQLRSTARLLKKYRGSLEYAVANLASYASGLGEAVGSGPFFQAYVENLTEPQSLAPVMSSILGASK